MKLRNELAVAAPLARTWRTLLDVQRVASALPGASVEPGPTGGEHRGTMRVRIGPVTAEYAGTARLEEVDEDAHEVSYHVQGSGRAGTAAATVAARLEEEPGGAGTRVVVETDLRVTGRVASFGRGLMEDVAGRMLDEFARRLESEILAGDDAAAGASVRDVSTPARSTRPDEPLDVGAAAWEPLLRRYGVPALLVLVLLLLLRRPKVIVVTRRP